MIVKMDVGELVSCPTHNTTHVQVVYSSLSISQEMDT